MPDPMTSPTPSAVLVHKRRQATTVEQLGMECDEYDTPTALRGEEPSSWWLAKQAGFSGPAQDEASGEVAEGGIGVYSTALAIAENDLLGIIAPDDFSAAALWFSWPLAEIQVNTEGSKGLFRKRPAVITLTMGGSELTLGGINRLWRNSNRAEPWQEQAFIEAVSG